MIANAQHSYGHQGAKSQPNSLTFAAFAISIFTLFQLLFPITVAKAQDDTNLSPDEARQELKKVEQELKHALDEKKDVSLNIKRLASQRASLNALLLETARTIKKGEGQLTKLEGRLEELTAQEDLLRGSIKERHDTISRLLAVMQRMGRQPPPVMATHRDDALKMVRSAMLLASVFPPLKSQAEKLTAELTDLVRITADIRVKADELKKENRELAKEKIRITALLAAKKTRILEKQTSLKSIRDSAEKFKKNVENLGVLITKLDREVEEKAALGEYEKELAKLEEDIKSGRVLEIAPEKKKVAMVAPGRMKPTVSFSRIKGLLPLPVQGKRVSKFGTKDDLGRVNEGILIETRSAAQITSPNDGWVVYSGPFRKYGQLLIINAGGGYHVLLAGMGQIDVEEGQFVIAGEPVGTMGGKRTSATTNVKKDSLPALYVEFRKDGRPVDPDPWWEQTSEKAQG